VDRSGLSSGRLRVGSDVEAELDTSDPVVTPARVDTDSAAAPAPTRATRWGEVGPDERREVRSRFGTTVWAARLAAGPTQAGLAARAGVSERTVRALEAGTQRPSDATTAALAAALCPHRDALTIAVLDIELQIAAGASLRPRHRRRPPRVRRQRIYAAARRQLAERREAQQAEDLDAMVGFALAAMEPEQPDPWAGARRPAVGPS
jgi:transcriptional regulator with XRE-family HTH domain